MVDALQARSLDAHFIVGGIEGEIALK